MTVMTPEQMRALVGRLAKVVDNAIADSFQVEGEFCVTKAERDAVDAERVEAESVRDEITAALRTAADQLEAVRMKAGIHAVAAHALGRSDQERDWLDILTIIPPDTAPQEDRDE